MIGKKLHIDFETYSEINLKHVGAYRYAEHPSTEVLMMSYKLGAERTRMWLPGMPFPPRVVQWVKERCTLGAHNAMFEYCIWNIVLKRMLRKVMRLPKLHSTMLDCTAARAAMCGLPRALGKAGAVLELEIQKDKRGETLVKFFCQPRKPTKNNPDTRNLPEHYPEMWEEFQQYCITDTDSEYELDGRLPAMHPFDLRTFQLDMRVNSRGIPVDIPTIKRAGVIVRELERRAHERVVALTGVRPTQVQKLKEWMAEQGVDLDNMQADTIKALLAKPDSGLDDTARAILELRMEASKVSTKKLISMLKVACEDMRARGTLMYYGAHTGRWSGKLIQPHNFIRGLPDKQAQIALMKMVFPLLTNADADLFEIIFDNPLTSIAQCMRGFIRAEDGNILRIVDYAQIEARILVWLAGQEDVIAQFKQGLDVYKMLASFLFKIPVSEVSGEQRRIAKNLVLGCGFGLGHKKFIEYCAKAGLIIDADMSQRAVKAYRERNPKVVEYWADVERCAIAAVRAPGKHVRLNQVTFYCEPDKSYLRVILPSGRSLYYPLPQVRIIERYGRPQPQLSFMTEVKGNLWLRTTTYGGRLVENIVQGIACDIMVTGGLKAEAHGYPLVLTVHDEWLSECKKNFGNLKQLEALVCDVGSAYAGCPITAEGFETVRYRKN